MNNWRTLLVYSIFNHLTKYKCRYGTLQIPKYAFEERENEFFFTSNLTRREVIFATVKVTTECLKILKLAILQTHYTKSLKLEEFEQMQTTASDQGAAHLKER